VTRRAVCERRSRWPLRCVVRGVGDPLERELVARLKRGEPAAFDEAWEAYRARLFGFLLRLCHRREVAEDLLQETWLRLATRAPLLRDDTRLSSWLFTVARNLFVSSLRSRRHRAEGSPENEPEAEWATGPSPFDQAAAVELRRRLEDALARLPTAQREALLLVAVEGFTPSEAAGIVGLRPEALRQRLSRARARLQVLLQPPAHDSRARPEGTHEILWREV
jgi:RNA polymerase sigma-70 factor (ECF subfamily)